MTANLNIRRAVFHCFLRCTAKCSELGDVIDDIISVFWDDMIRLWDDVISGSRERNAGGASPVKLILFVRTCCNALTGPFDFALYLALHVLIYSECNSCDSSVDLLRHITIQYYSLSLVLVLVCSFP